MEGSFSKQKLNHKENELKLVFLGDSSIHR